jgi:hypothetical protein
MELGPDAATVRSQFAMADTRPKQNASRGIGFKRRHKSVAIVDSG